MFATASTTVSWRRFLAGSSILAAILGGTFAAGAFLRLQGSPLLEVTARFGGYVIALGWCLHGLYSLLQSTQGKHATPWRHATAHLAITVGGSIVAELAARFVAVPVGTVLQVCVAGGSLWIAWSIFSAAPQYRRLAAVGGFLIGTWLLVWYLTRHGMPTASITIASIAAMGVGFTAGVTGLRAILSGSGFAAVAKTVVDEAIRMQVTLVLLILFLLSLPLLPLLLDSGELLEYRVQFLLTWALGSTTVLLGLLNVFLGCGSLCGDIDSSRIHMTLTKPLGRLEYLVGKWVGLVAVNLLLVALAGIGIYAFTRILAVSPAQSPADRRAVDEQVLVARQSIRPEHPSGQQFDKAVKKLIADLEKEMPDAFKSDRQATVAKIQEQTIRQWHTLDPDKISQFVFRGLSRAKNEAPFIHLRVRPYAEGTGYDGGDVSFALWLNDRAFPYRDGEHVPYVLVGGVTHTIEIPTAAIDDAGILKVTIQNRNLVMPGATGASWIQFVPGAGMEVLQPVGEFAPNFIKCLIVIWLKLSMIAAVAVTAATFLGFPVAILLSLMIFFSAFGGAFISDSLEFYTGMSRPDEGIRDIARLRYAVFTDLLREREYWEAVKSLLAMVGEVFMTLIPSFQKFDTITALAGGMRIGIRTLLESFLRVGVIAPVTLGLIAWFFFERRDLVRSNT